MKMPDEKEFTYMNLEALSKAKGRIRGDSGAFFENGEAHQAFNYNILKTIFVKKRFDLYERLLNSTFPVCFETCFPAYGYGTGHLVDLLLESNQLELVKDSLTVIF